MGGLKSVSEVGKLEDMIHYSSLFQLIEWSRKVIDGVNVMLL